MKCKFIRELEVSPGVMPAAFVGENAVARTVKRNGRMCTRLFWKVGTIFDLPDAYLQVQQGNAIPADKECEDAAGMTPEQMSEAQRVYPRTAAGIHPGDFYLYDNEIITGYDEHGNYKPGPNFHLLKEAAEEAEAEEVVTSKGPE